VIPCARTGVKSIAEESSLAKTDLKNLLCFILIALSFINTYFPLYTRKACGQIAPDFLIILHGTHPFPKPYFVNFDLFSLSS